MRKKQTVKTPATRRRNPKAAQRPASSPQAETDAGTQADASNKSTSGAAHASAKSKRAAQSNAGAAAINLNATESLLSLTDANFAALRAQVKARKPKARQGSVAKDEESVLDALKQLEASYRELLRRS
jgi:hypothetical protein